MSGGRGSRGSRASKGSSSHHNDDVNSRGAATAARTQLSKTCAFADRVCQRPAVSASSNLCWLHGKTDTTNQKSRKGSAVAPCPAVDVGAEEHAHRLSDISVVSGPSEEEIVHKLLRRYVSPSEKPSSSVPKPGEPVPAATSTNKHEYLDTLGAISLDYPAASFMAMDDSASDDGSDEFGSGMPLGHAGVYTAEEIVAMACDRMKRLRRLYVNELKQIGAHLKSSRRKYLSEVGRDRRRRVGDPVTDYVAVSAEQRRYQQMLKAMRCHRRRYPCPDSVLRWTLKTKSKIGSKSKETRSTPQPNGRLCSVTSCEATTLPLTKYCSKHILLDRRQLLFSKCPGIGISAPDKCPVSTSTAVDISLDTTDDYGTAQLFPQAGALKSHAIECGRLIVQNTSRGGINASLPRSDGVDSPPAYLCSMHRALATISPSVVTPNAPTKRTANNN